MDPARQSKEADKLTVRSVQTLTERVGSYVHAYTSYGSVRPFGISSIIASNDRVAGPQIFVVEPSGAWHGYRAAAVGKGRQLAKTQLEKLELDQLSARQAVKEVARM